MKTTCSYCGVGCGVVVHQERSNTNVTPVFRVEGDPAHPGSKGMLCSKGMNLHYTVMDQSDRLLYPQMRYNRAGMDCGSCRPEVKAMLERVGKKAIVGA